MQGVELAGADRRSCEGKASSRLETNRKRYLGALNSSVLTPPPKEHPPKNISSHHALSGAV